jgi:dipeptidyl aminopeptidase/acylaminoacyl peptidase
MRELAAAADEPLVVDSDVKILNDWSPDGAHIVYSQLSEHSRLDLWRVNVRDGTATPLLTTPANETQARLSPTGQWLAYVSDESGVANVYVTDFPALAERHVVTSTGGGQPQWSADERELFLMAPDRSIISVDIRATRDRLLVGSPTRLFRASLTAGPNDARDSYVAAPDGSRFLIDGAEVEASPAITLMVNWFGGEERYRRTWRDHLATLWRGNSG